MDKLEVFAIDELTMDGHDDTLVLCVRLTDKWCKPLRDIGFGFDDVMKDLNKKITCALWRFDPKTDRKVDMMFDPNTQLDDFQQTALKDFFKKEAK